eukprot:653037-Rhodomonas_salina.1
MLYILRPQQDDAKGDEKSSEKGGEKSGEKGSEKSGGKPAALGVSERTAMDMGVANTAAAVLATCVCNTVSPAFTTNEDIAGFALAVVVY